MKIENNKNYKVVKYFSGEQQSIDYGVMTGSDVKAVIGTAKFDEFFGMWFTSKATIGYEIAEC